MVVDSSIGSIVGIRVIVGDSRLVLGLAVEISALRGVRVVGLPIKLAVKVKVVTDDVHRGERLGLLLEAEALGPDLGPLVRKVRTAGMSGGVSDRVVLQRECAQHALVLALSIARREANGLKARAHTGLERLGLKRPGENLGDD